MKEEIKRLACVVLTVRLSLTVPKGSSNHLWRPSMQDIPFQLVYLRTYLPSPKYSLIGLK